MILMSVFLIIPAFAGWLSGFIVNYLADVLPITRTLSWPVCHECHQNYRTVDYLALRPCINGHRRSRRTWFTAFLVMAASVYIWFEPPEKLGYILGMMLVTYFAVVFVIDLEHRLILHPTSLAGAILGFIVGLTAHDLTSTLIGGFSGLTIMLAFYALGMLFTRYRANRMRAAGHEQDEEEALGAGDVILATILGLILGWPLIWFGLLFGILLGGLVSLLIVVWLVGSRRYKENALMMFIPYGPYFLSSAFLIIFFPGWVAGIVPG